MILRNATIKYLVIHHTADNAKDTQALRQIHLNMGFDDIGYNGVIEKNGVICAGRDVKWQGAHDTGTLKGETLSMNRIGYGLACIGMFHGPKPDEMGYLQFNSLVKEAFRVCKLFNIPLSNVKQHKDSYATACPGDNFPWTRFIKELELLFNPAPVAPVTSQKIIHPNDIYLSVRVLDHLADQAIKDINKLGFACKRLDLA